MRNEWDEAKDEANRAKHGLSLADAERLDWDAAPVPDLRRDYGETRLVQFGRIDGRLHVCVFVFRGESRRIISLRKANSREERRYG